MMAEMRYWRALIAISFSLSIKTTHSTISVTKIEYIGKRNVWHEGEQYHEHLDVGNPDDSDVGESKVLQLCANECTLAKHECDGFYVSTFSNENGNTSCHLVDHEHARLTKQPTVGHGEDTDRVYYIKEEISRNSISKPQDLIPPCDQDRSTMSSCDDLRSGDQIKYYSCTNCTGCTYLKTVSQLISDEACTDENRIIQCELENENVTANFDIATTVSKHAYLKSFVPGSGQGMIVERKDGDDLQWFESTFKTTDGPQELSRVIIRSLSNDVDQIQDGKVTLYRDTPEAFLERQFTFQSEDCVVAINFSDAGFTADEKSIIENTSKIRITIDRTRSEVKGKRGFKLDLFIKKKLSY